MNEPQFDAVNEAKTDASDQGQHPSARPFLGIHFQCCRTYGRIYRNAQQTEYSGQCPRCHCRIRVPIGPGGSSSRFFNAG